MSYKRFIVVLGVCVFGARVEGAGPESGEIRPMPIDLPTALRLAGAQNLDVQIAREKLTEAKAIHETTRNQFFPWLAPGLAYRRHDGRIQDVGGNMLDVSKQSYTIGGALNAQVELGDAWFRNLESRQAMKAAGYALDARRAESIYAAARGYFDLTKASATMAIAGEARKIAEDYSDQLARAVKAGIAFEGDALRARVQLENAQLAVEQAVEQRRVEAARLAQALRLDITVPLAPAESDLSPMTLTPDSQSLESLVARALFQRPELKRGESLIVAAKESQRGAKYGPLIPSAGAQLFLGGLGGGRGGSTGNFGDSEDFLVGLSWRLGPGGLFDRSRIHIAESRMATAAFETDKLRDEIIRQVVEAQTRVRSLVSQMATTRKALEAAERGLRLTRERKEFAVGIVLENIQAQQDLTRARLAYLTAVAEHNKSQYALSFATGALDEPGK
jgi:outer membrane protein TolC